MCIRCIGRAARQGSQAAWLERLARPLSVLTGGLLTRVLLRRCVLARHVMREELTTICAAMLERLARPLSVLTGGLLTSAASTLCAGEACDGRS